MSQGAPLPVVDCGDWWDEVQLYVGRDKPVTVHNMVFSPTFLLDAELPESVISKNACAAQVVEQGWPELPGEPQTNQH